MRGGASKMSFREADRVLRAHGWECVRVRGSHHQYRAPSGTLYTVAAARKGEPVHKKVEHLVRRMGDE